MLVRMSPPGFGSIRIQLLLVTIRVGEATRHQTSMGGLVDAAWVVCPVLVGRAAELDRLVAAVSKAPAVVVVEGEAGIGKSRLVAESVVRPEVDGRRFLIGGCNRIREPFPLGPLVEALRGVAGLLPEVTLTPVTGTLRGLLPELAHVLPERLEPLADRTAERHRLFRGLSDLLGTLGPAVLVVEAPQGFRPTPA